jgi:hypothetical protein
MMTDNEVPLTLLGNIPEIAVKSIVDDRWGVEGIYSQQFSVGIFFFLIICILVFTVIVIKFMGTSKVNPETGIKSNDLKTGEKILFIWIFIGIVVAVIMGAVQLLQGYLF